MTTDVTDLSCMDGDNYAAIALQMQKTALEAEARIYALEQLLRRAVNPYTIIQTSTANITGIAAFATGEQHLGPIGGGTFTTSFNNTPSSRNIDEAGRNLVAELGEGEYEIGIFAQLQPSGVVDDNSVRAVTVAVDRLDPTVISSVTPSERRVCEAVYTDFEPNVAIPVDVCVSLRYRLTTLDRIKFLVYSGNASSTLNCLAGTIIWLTKIGTADSVVVT
jgi:hypothetical protein